ncbi:MAG: nitrogen regulation protein NR(I) [Pseudomonadota bacterium]|nr:nitrogen regulation protein NR(I) [Pseudomonadota bacterium]
MAEQARVWVVDDDRGVRFVLATALREAGYAVSEFESAQAALHALDAGVPGLVFTDVRMPGEDGIALLRKLKATHASVPVIVMSAYTDIASTAGAFRGGAWEFLSKPFDLDHAVSLASRVLPAGSIAPAPAQGRPEPAPVAASELIGDSARMREVFRGIGKLAQVPLSVLVTGETGTGKELVARALHRESPRADKPFIALNTGAIPAELLESELFGHEAGAFTGANKRHVGRFEQADRGTLFLDEIGDMPLPLQVRLLRVLAEGEFFRVGGRELIKVDVRVIAATHQPLEHLVVEGRFRADLLHRLDVVRLQLPPLRERRDDIPLLARRFLEMAARRLGASPKRLAPAAIERLRAHGWPGNVRELENACWRLAALAPNDNIDAADVDALAGLAVRETATVSAAGGNDWESALAGWARTRLAEDAEDLHAEARDRMEQVLFDAALEHTDGHRGEAAARLGLGRNTLTRRLGKTRRR